MHPPGTPIQWVRVAVLAEKPDSQSKFSVHGKFGCKIYGSSLSDKDVARGCSLCFHSFQVP